MNALRSRMTLPVLLLPTPVFPSSMISMSDSSMILDTKAVCKDKLGTQVLHKQKRKKIKSQLNLFIIINIMFCGCAVSKNCLNMFFLLISCYEIKNLVVILVRGRICKGGGGGGGREREKREREREIQWPT